MITAMSTRDLLACRDFMRLWYARLAGVGASQMLLVAIGWQMYDLTGSAWDLGLVGLLQFLPALALVLAAGHVVDRHHRARIVALCVAVQGLVALALAATPLDGLSQRTLLLALSVVLGAVRAFQMPAQQALVPLLVPSALLPRAMAFSSAGLQGAIIAGPALGGFVYVAGPSLVYGLCAALFALASALCLRIRHADPPPGQPILQVGPLGLGLLRGAPALGALAMSIALTRWPIARHAGPKLFATIAVFGLATLVFALSTHFLLSLAALCVTGAADMVSIVVRQTMIQLETPDDMRGRVSAVASVFIGASNQLGEFESGATAAWLGPVGSVLLGGAGTLLVAALWWRGFPALARRDALVQDSTPHPPRTAARRH
jgi:MFS family permease